MDRTNVSFMTCSCGCTQFEMIEIVEITKFYEQEYKNGFTERRPSFFSTLLKMKCISCGKFYKEE